jgi:hypothetical protein
MADEIVELMLVYWNLLQSAGNIRGTVMFVKAILAPRRQHPSSSRRQITAIIDALRMTGRPINGTHHGSCRSRRHARGLISEPCQFLPQHLRVLADVENPASQLPPVVHRLVLREVLVVLIALDFQNQRHAGLQANEKIGDVGMAHIEVFIRNGEFQMVVFA